MPVDNKKSNAFEAKDIILRRTLKGELVDVAPMTNSNMVYTDSDTTLTETLDKINSNIGHCQKKEDGKGLSTNDFDDEWKDKLETDYTKDEVDAIAKSLNDLLPHIREV